MIFTGMLKIPKISFPTVGDLLRPHHQFYRPRRPRINRDTTIKAIGENTKGDQPPPPLRLHVPRRHGALLRIRYDPPSPL